MLTKPVYIYQLLFCLDVACYSVEPLALEPQVREFVRYLRLF
jgi:hypothetical protein